MSFLWLYLVLRLTDESLGFPIITIFTTSIDIIRPTAQIIFHSHSLPNSQWHDKIYSVWKSAVACSCWHQLVTWLMTSPRPSGDSWSADSDTSAVSCLPGVHLCVGTAADSVVLFSRRSSWKHAFTDVLWLGIIIREKTLYVNRVFAP